MKVGIITSFHEKCGISSYTENLVEGLISNGLEVKVAANYPKDKLLPDEPYVSRFFHAPFMTHEKTADVEGMVNYLKDCDIIHCQFETSLYSLDYFSDLMTRLKLRNKKIVFTMHSGGIWSNFPIALIDHFITHDAPFASSEASVIQMGVRIYKENDDTPLPNSHRMISFGLGRNNDDYVHEAIKDTEMTYLTSYGHHTWLPIKDLVNEIRKSWIICLLYPPIGNTNVSSSAVTLAMGCDRPILVSNTNWFNHIIDYPNIYVCDDINDLRNNIKYLTDHKNLSNILKEINEMKGKLIKEKRTFDDFVVNHINLYDKLLKS